MIGGYYATDFRTAARRYGTLGRPADVAAKIAELQAADCSKDWPMLKKTSSPVPKFPAAGRNR